MPLPQGSNAGVATETAVGYIFMNNKWKNRAKSDIRRYGNAVIKSSEMQEAFTQTHHKVSTLGEHTMRVAVSSVILCYALQRVGLNVNMSTVVIAALCHDLGMLGRHDRYASKKEAKREHPKASVKIAKEIVGELPEETEEAIRRHMWPTGSVSHPNSLEGCIISVADKYNAVKDLIKGSERKKQ